MFSRDRGGHQNTIREGLIVKGHLYVTGPTCVCGWGWGRWEEGAHVRDRGGDQMNWEGHVVFILYHKYLRYLFYCIILS